VPGAVNCVDAFEKRRRSKGFQPHTGAAATLVARLKTGEQAAHRIAGLVADRFAAEDVAVSLSDAGRGRWQVAIYFRAAPDEEAVRGAVAAAAGRNAAASVHFARVAATDWVRDSLTGLAPVAAGRFIVHGAHDRAHVPVNRIGIEIEAALAFGTGHHGTTRGCLLALDRICKSMSKSRVAPSPCKGEGRGGGHCARTRQTATPTRLAFARRPPPFRGRDSNGFQRILDLGTGSGVLAIAAARALRRRVLATDIDAGAVRAARASIQLNRVGALVEVVKANGVTARRVSAAAPFALVFANILLEPLCRFAAPLRKLTAPGARIVLSGLLPAQASAVIAAYRPLALEWRIDLDGWTTLVFARAARQRQRASRPRTRPGSRSPVN
jgi:ribosomal protein L11 methyltransferase